MIDQVLFVATAGVFGYVVTLVPCLLVQRIVRWVRWR